MTEIAEWLEMFVADQQNPTALDDWVSTTVDAITADVDLPADLCVGDVLAVPATGAYGRSMASNYNLFPRPGVAWVDGARQGWVLRPESVEDLLRLEGQ